MQIAAAAVVVVVVIRSFLQAVFGCRDQPVTEHYPLLLHPWMTPDHLLGAAAVTKGSAKS